MKRGIHSLLTISGRRGYGLALACVIVAAGAIMLVRSQGAANASPGSIHGDSMDLSTAPPDVHSDSEAPRLTFSRPGISGTIALTQGAVLAGGTGHLYAELNIAADRADQESQRRPVALAVVLDVSGSMSGEKIEEARRAVSALITAMDDRDRIALIAYNNNVEVIQNLESIRSVRQPLLARLRHLSAGGGTNIPSGLMAGATALSRANSDLTRRVVLISDGLDGSGRQLSEVRSTIRAQADAGMVFSSLGVGTDYSEPFLMAVSDSGHGNYEFLASSALLHRFLARELQQASSTRVEQVCVHLELPPGWALHDAHGVVTRGTSGSVRIPFGSLYSGEERRAVLNLRVTTGVPGQRLAFGAFLRYRDANENAVQSANLGSLAVQTVTEANEVLASRSDALYADTVTTAIDARQARSVEAWREGRNDEALQLSVGNINELRRLQTLSFSQERANRISEFNEDNNNFQNVEAQSQAGRAYGLQSNQQRWSRARGR